MKLVKFFHKHHLTIQVITNFCAILGVLVAVFQISSTKQIIQAIFQSQEKAASYRLMAMKTEVKTNLERIDDALAHQAEYERLHEVFQVPLSTAVYFSNPTFFKLDRLDKDGNNNLNEKISRIYVSWQVANNLIQSNQSLFLNANANPGLAKVNLLKNNLKILEILGRTRQPASDVLKAIEDEPGPA